MRYPLATSTWDSAELEAIYRVANSGLCTMGNQVARYEAEFASFVGSRYAVMVNSGSSANLIMVASLFYRAAHALKPGDEVIVPAVSWPTTYYPLSQYGLELKFVDIDMHTLNFDMDSLENAIGASTRAIMVVNLLGNPNDFDRLQAIIGDRDILLIEDNCESLGAEYKGRKAGTFGLMGSFSTFFSHHMSTMEGGVVVTDDEELYHILLCLRAHGWTRNLPKVNKVTGEKSDDAFEESWNFVLPGYNVRPLEMEAAVGSVQLKKLPAFLEYRIQNAQIFNSLFADDSRFFLQAEIGKSSWFGFTLVAKPSTGISRNKLAKLLIDNEIECRPIVAGNFARKKVVKYMKHNIHGELRNADWIDANGLFVGNHQYDISENLQDLKRVIGRYN